MPFPLPNPTWRQELPHKDKELHWTRVTSSPQIVSWQSWNRLSPAEFSRKGILKTALGRGAQWSTLDVNQGLKKMFKTLYLQKLLQNYGNAEAYKVTFIL